MLSFAGKKHITRHSAFQIYEGYKIDKAIVIERNNSLLNAAQSQLNTMVENGIYI